MNYNQKKKKNGTHIKVSYIANERVIKNDIHKERYYER